MLTGLETNWFRSNLMAFCMRTTGNAWEDFITEAMTSLHGGAFVQVAASGRGDKGCDGYVDGLMLAAYGASSPNDKYVTKKIKDDFAKAKRYWGEMMERWAFVHNDAQGLPVMAAQTIASLRKAEQAIGGISVEQWTPYTLWTECLQYLDSAALSHRFGEPPSEQAAGIQYIASCVRALARTRLIPGLDEVAEVPPGKIEHNGFNEETTALLKNYEALTGHVRYYFERSTPGEEFQVSENIRIAYDGLKAELHDSNLVFQALVRELESQAFVDNGTDHLQERRSAALMVATHFFETCTIFESPPTGAVTADATAV
ncbi:hypothetical protein D0Z06_22775 [Geodermatophilus marinus]|nr:hypothetical protein D0Z06_22775 [Geodermatophilus sp. LHW52908]